MKENNKIENQAPSTGSNTKSRQMFKDTLTRALLENDSKRLRALCEKMLYFAEHEAIQVNDFITIMKFIAERVDGKPAQAIEITDHSLTLPSVGQYKFVKVEPSKDD